MIHFKPALPRGVLFLSLAGALTFGPALPAFAATATSNFNVTANVVSACTISTTALAFGNYDPTQAGNTTAGSTVTATCTSGAMATIGMSLGSNPAAKQRQMKDASAALLAYNLFQPPDNLPGTACSYTSPGAWGDGSPSTGTVLTLTAAPSVAPRTYNVCGSIPAGQSVTAATTYSDTVTATINF